jgi:MFS transporter, FHS family, L-fucose permease
MIGRWIGAISVFQLSRIPKLIATIVVPFVAFGIILYANSLKGTDISDLYNYAIVIVIGIAAFLMAQEKPVKTMVIVCILAIVSMLIGVFTTGLVSVYAFISGGLFCSVMWPCIFALSVTGLGKHTSQGSAFLITMILGGAIIPPFQGAIGDSWNIHLSYLIAAVCFVGLLVLTLLIKKSLTAQNIDVDHIEAEGGH